ncbi:F0F1 ATP synthase subunit epsilon [Flavobacterium aestuarii]|uniref:F0F1 ATP synthase subunit epsilon n=1 Tax=Flavobacterium aestuarii TaxID=3149227 RepID=UPI0032B3BD35
MILEIVSPEAKLFSGEITSISVPGVDGRFQMLNNHAPIVSLLQKGTINITTAQQFEINEETVSLFIKVSDNNYTLEINSGTLELKDNKVIVLAD